MDTIVVAGTGRSGTTWVGEVICHATGARMLFEPFVLTDQNRFAFLQPAKRLRRNYQLYIPPQGEVPRRYAAQIHKIVGSGARPDELRPTKLQRVIKEIRANLFLGYLARCWQSLRIVLVLRDPYEVIASQLTSRRLLGWEFDWRKEDVLAQPALMRDHLEPYRAVMEEAACVEERLACRWCIETLVALRQTAGMPNVLVCWYQDLLQGEAGWTPVVEHLRRYPWSTARFRKQLPVPSSTSRWSRLRWELSSSQRRGVRAVIERFRIALPVRR